MKTKNESKIMIKSKIENQSINTILETVMGECESIISTVEDFINENESTQNLDDFEQIRYTAEELQSITCHLEDESITEEEKMNALEVIEELSIQLYQEIKYEIEALELFDYNLQEFEYLRSSINTIRSLFV
jgi:hypothetical protein